MCSHYLVDPVACTPASGWEKGQVENQVGLVREQFFAPRVRAKSYEELNAWLLDKCIAYARAHRHPEVRVQTVWEMFEAERASLVRYAGRFDGFHAVTASVSKTCLVRFDNNRYSVSAHAVGRPVEIRAYAERIELRQDGRLVGEHARSFGRDQTVFDPWHYVPVLVRKPGALRNGAPFQDWVLPAALQRIRRKLTGSADGDRQMVKILAAVLSDGLAAVEAACQEALRDGVHSADIVINILARKREPAPPITIMTPDALRLHHAPVADCTTLEQIAVAEVTYATTNLFDVVTSRLPASLRASIDLLVEVPEGDARSSLFRLKDYPKSANAAVIKSDIVRLRLIEELLGTGGELDELDPKVVRQLGEHRAPLPCRRSPTLRQAQACRTRGLLPGRGAQDPARPDRRDERSLLDRDEHPLRCQMDGSHLTMRIGSGTTI